MQSLLQKVDAYSADQMAMLPSSAPPTINRSLVSSFSVRNKVVIEPRRGTSDMISVEEEEHKRERDVLWRYPSP